MTWAWSLLDASSSSILDRIKPTNTPGNALKVALQRLNIKLQCLSSYRVVIDVILQFLCFQEFFSVRHLRFLVRHFVSLSVVVDLRLRSLRPAVILGTTILYVFLCHGCSLTTHVWINVVWILKVNNTVDLFLPKLALQRGPYSWRLNQVLRFVCVIADLLTQDLLLVLNWHRLEA